METNAYETLVSNTKKHLSEYSRKEIENATYVNTLLEDCSACINQSLSLATEKLSEICISKVTQYLDDTVCLLKMLLNLINSVTEVRSMTCCEMETLPTLTGTIIFTVYRHCKDRVLYGPNLCNVEKELKYLYINCQELQSAYLMILENYFVFDLNDMNEKKILLEALDINIKIGEILHSIDVKTMATHWMQFIIICGKYVAILSATNFFEECFLVLYTLLKSDIQVIIQADDEPIRSLKVSNIILKILMRMCAILKIATKKNYGTIINLIFYIQDVRFRHIEMTTKKSGFVTYVVQPLEALLKDLLFDEVFADSLLSCDQNELMQEDKIDGFVLTITSVMELLANGLHTKSDLKSKLIDSLYSVLPECHFWTGDLTFVSDSTSTQHGLYEHVLLHATSLAFTLTSEEFILLEKHMIEAILSTDSTSALFSANLWELVLSRNRHINPQLLFNQTTWLCTMFKRLENHAMFHRSPQERHLSFILGSLFNLLEDVDKLKICKQFRIHDDNNFSLWAALGVNRLPQEAKNAAEEFVADQLKTQMGCLSSSQHPLDIDKVTKVMSLAATCSLDNTRGVKDYLMKAWSKTCPQTHFIINEVNAGTVWFYDYLQALVSLTDSMWNELCSRKVYTIMIPHCMCRLIQQGIVEFKLLFINILCKIASKISNEWLSEAFKILSSSEEIVQMKLFVTLKQYVQNRNIDAGLGEDYLIRWFKTKARQDFRGPNNVRISVKYIHKCLA